MLGLLSLGFLIGMRHALEADHIAAVSSLATRTRSPADCVRQGVFWGVGHTVTLFLFGSTVLVLNGVLPEGLVSGLELAVGLMLMGLGADVLRRLVRERVHFHVHDHDQGLRHFHGHSHRGASGHDHHHAHAGHLPWRALAIGLMHGMAGSAALIVLTLQTAPSAPSGLLYILFFGFGSIAGMAFLSLALALPLRVSLGGLTRFHGFLHAAVGVVTIGLGLATTAEAGSTILAIFLQRG
jgi:ABC-type nickel/cobalt efflux system permease component RcnA